MIAHACHLIPTRPGPSDRCGWGSGKVNSESAALADFRAPGIQDWADFKELHRENARLIKELNAVYTNIDRLKESR